MFHVKHYLVTFYSEQAPVRLYHKLPATLDLDYRAGAVQDHDFAVDFALHILDGLVHRLLDFAATRNYADGCCHLGVIYLVPVANQLETAHLSTNYF
jgi:hypothetical protein